MILAVVLYAILAAGLSLSQAIARFSLAKNAVAEPVISTATQLMRPVEQRPSPASELSWDVNFPAEKDASYLEAVDYERASARPRHVVFWLAESVGRSYTSLYGYEKDTTPRLDGLRTSSLRFDRYYANTPISAHAIFGALCGWYPYPDSAFITQVNPRIACPSLMEVLTEKGYDSGAVSRWNFRLHR